MASLKQHKAIGEDLWKGRTDKIVSFILLEGRLLIPCHFSERRALRPDIWRARRTAHPGL